MSGIIPVTNIVRYTCDDGAGLRTTVFLQGCHLHCPWCSNPETISCNNIIWFDEDFAGFVIKYCSTVLELADIDADVDHDVYTPFDQWM